MPLFKIVSGAISSELVLPFSFITRVSSLKILGITITGKMSVSEHVRSLINSCAQTIHAIRILRSRGMDIIIMVC